MKFLVLALFLICSFHLPCAARELNTVESTDLRISPEVDYLSAGPWLNQQQTHYRVILMRSEIGAKIIVQKLFLGDQGKKGQIKWSRLLDFGKNTLEISSKEFIDSFNWHSPTSFSFRVNNVKYIIKDISRSKPQLKKALEHP